LREGEVGSGLTIRWRNKRNGSGMCDEGGWSVKEGKKEREGVEDMKDIIPR
jgi:hypothetical protein